MTDTGNRDRLRRLPDLARAGERLRDSSADELLATLADEAPAAAMREGRTVATEGPLAGPAGPMEAAIAEERREVVEAGQRGIGRLMDQGEDARLTPAEAIGVEAIILLTGRPAILIQDGRFFPPPRGWEVLEQHRDAIQSLFRSVGRVEVTGHPEFEWVGTGFLVGPDVMMTNRHVAAEFTAPRGDGRWGIRPGMTARIDFAEEFGGTRPAEVPIRALIGIHGRFDMALFRLDRTAPLPAALPILPARGRPKRMEGRQVYVVGYPAWDGRRNDPEPMQRLFGNIFNVKRLQPGEVMRLADAGRLFHHDCSTLGGNSGSCVVDLDSHRVLGLHFGGRFGGENQAVSLWELADDPLIRRAGVTIG